MADILDLSGFDPDNIPEGEVAPDGTEARLRITNVIKGTDKNGTDYIMPFFEDPENPNLKDFGDYLPLPNGQDTPKEVGNKLRRLKLFSESFQVNIFGGEFDLSECEGQTGWVILGIGKDRDDSPVNKVKKYLVQS